MQLIDAIDSALSRGRELERTLWAVGRLTLSPDADGLRAVSEHVIELAMRWVE